MTYVIDIHSHLWAEEWLPEEWWNAYVELIHRELEKAGNPKDRATIRSEYLPSFMDPEGERLLHRMEETDVDRQVVFPVDWSYDLSEPPVSIREYNRIIAEFQEENADRIVAFAAIDPRRENAAEFFEEALTDLGMQGLKLHPTSGYYPNGEETRKLLDVAAAHNVPVLTHTGPINGPLYSKYTKPIHIDEILTDYPDLNVIAAHMGLGWWRDLLAIAEMNGNANMYVDICAWQERVETDPTEFARAVRKFIDALGADRVLFGTDNPAFDFTYPTEDWIETVSSLADREEEPTFTDSEIEMILRENARTLLE